MLSLSSRDIQLHDQQHSAADAACLKYSEGAKTVADLDSAAKEIVAALRLKTAAGSLVEVHSGGRIGVDIARVLRGISDPKDQRELGIAICREILGPQEKIKDSVANLARIASSKLRFANFAEVATALNLLSGSSFGSQSVDTAAYSFMQFRTAFIPGVIGSGRPTHLDAICDDPKCCPAMLCVIRGKPLAVLYKEAGNDTTRLAELDRLYAERAIILDGKTPIYNGKEEAEQARVALTQTFPSFDFSVTEVGDKFHLVPSMPTSSVPRK